MMKIKSILPQTANLASGRPAGVPRHQPATPTPAGISPAPPGVHLPSALCGGSSRSISMLRHIRSSALPKDQDDSFDLDAMLADIGFGKPAVPEKTVNAFSKLSQMYEDAGISQAGVLYRSDTRSPESIFKDGFQAAGTETDLQKHVYSAAKDGKETQPKSAYVSTSRVPEGTTMMWGSKEALGNTYLYMIRNQEEGIDVSQALGEPAENEMRFSHEKEIAVKGGIAACDVLNAVRIVQFQPVELIVNPGAASAEEGKK